MLARRWAMNSATESPCGGSAGGSPSAPPPPVGICACGYTLLGRGPTSLGEEESSEEAVEARQRWLGNEKREKNGRRKMGSRCGNLDIFRGKKIVVFNILVPNLLVWMSSSFEGVGCGQNFRTKKNVTPINV